MASDELERNDEKILNVSQSQNVIREDTRSSENTQKIEKKLCEGLAQIRTLRLENKLYNNQWPMYRQSKVMK